MVSATNHVIAGGGVGVRVSVLWLIVTYFLQVVGELALSPVGLSSVTKLAPPRFVGQMMGVWFMSISLGNLVAGLLGGQVDPEKLNEMPALFQRTALTLFAAAAILALLVIPIRKMMQEGMRVTRGWRYRLETAFSPIILDPFTATQRSTTAPSTRGPLPRRAPRGRRTACDPRWRPSPSNAHSRRC